MDQQRIGNFLRQLRMEKKITQSQLAEILGVSNRTVSRWETGTNMPDFALLIEIADFYNVDVREILEGERRKNMNAPLKDEMVRIADYTKLEQERLSKIMRWMFIAGLAAMAAYLLIEGMEGYAYAKGLLLGGTTGTLLIGLLYTSKYMMRIREFKLKVLKKKRMNESGK